MAVHNHGTEEGKGLACRESMVSGELKGECMSESQNPTGLDVGLTLRDRIAAVLSQHDVNLPDKVADAVIRALGLTREKRELMDGMCGQSINYLSGKVTNHYRAATRQHRYVTEWTSEVKDGE